MSAKDFFLHELPQAIEQAKKLHSLPRVTFNVEFAIEDEGVFALVVMDGEMKVRRGGVANPLVAMQFTKETWDEILDKMLRPQLLRWLNLSPDNISQATENEFKHHLHHYRPVAWDQAIAAIKTLPLRLTAEMIPSSNSKFELRLGGADEDDSTVVVQITASDYEPILRGQLPLRQAFSEGKIKLKGSTSALMALLSRLFVRS